MTEKLTLMACVQVALALAALIACPAVWMLAVTNLREHLCRQHCRERRLMEAEAEQEAETLPEPKAA